MTVLAILKPFAPIRTGFLTRMQDDKSENNRGGSRGGAKGAQAPPSSPKHLKAPPSSSNATKCLKQIFNIFTHFRDDFNNLVHKDKYYC